MTEKSKPRRGPVDRGRCQPEGGRGQGWPCFGELPPRPLRPPVPGDRHRPPRPPGRPLRHRPADPGWHRGPAALAVRAWPQCGPRRSRERRERRQWRIDDALTCWVVGEVRGFEPLASSVRGVKGSRGDLRSVGRVLAELGRWRAGGDRDCPLRSGYSWSGCGPDVAPPVTAPPPMALHRWACDGSAGLSRHVRASILRPTTAAVPRISRRTMIQVIGGVSLPPRPPVGAANTTVPGAPVTALAPPIAWVRPVPRFPSACCCSSTRVPDRRIAGELAIGPGWASRWPTRR
jgi:hypothetical protein